MKFNLELTALATLLVILGAMFLAPTSFADSSVTIQPGDTLSSIATANQTTYVRIYNANENIQNPNVIYAGMNIRIPAKDENLPDRYSAFINPAPMVQYNTSQRQYQNSTNNQTSVNYNYPKQQTQPVQKQTPKAAPVSTGSTWDKIAACESGGNWSINTGNGYSGGLQFSPSTWSGYGGRKYAASANQATREQQIEIAKKVQASQGWGAWPACTAKIGLR